MSEQNEFSDFTASRDIVDSLKLEASILTPKQDRQLKDIAHTASKELQIMYGKYIPKETRNRVKGVEDRIIITDTDAYREMYTSWDTITVEPTPPDDNSRGTYFVQGRIVAFDDPDKLWDAIFSEETQRNLIERVGNEKEAKRMVVLIGLVDFAVHEVTHQYQNHSLPHAFLECATRYYQRQISNKLRIGHLIEDLTEDRIAFYQQLVDSYGEDMHRLFFNGKVGLAIKENALAMFEQEKEKLFPQGKGL